MLHRECYCHSELWRGGGSVLTVKVTAVVTESEYSSAGWTVRDDSNFIHVLGCDAFSSSSCRVILSTKVDSIACKFE